MKSLLQEICFFSLSRGFYFSPAFLSNHLLNKGGEIVDCFIELENHTVNMLSLASAFQANKVIKGAKLTT